MKHEYHVIEDHTNNGKFPNKKIKWLNFAMQIIERDRPLRKSPISVRPIILPVADMTISFWPSWIHVQTTCVDQRHTAGVKWNNWSSCRWLVRSASDPRRCSLNASRWWTGLVEYASTKPARHRSQCKRGIKAFGPFYLVSMPVEVKYPTSPHLNV